MPFMNLGAGRVELRKLDIEMELKRTPGGLCGFDIDYRGAEFEGTCRGRILSIRKARFSFCRVAQNSRDPRTFGEVLECDLSGHPEPLESRPRDRNSSSYEPSGDHTSTGAHQGSQHSDVFVGTAEEGRVRGIDRFPHEGQQGGHYQHDRRQASRDLVSGQAEVREVPSIGVAQGGSRVIEGVVCGSDCASLQDGGRWPLATHAEVRADHSPRGLCERDEGGVPRCHTVEKRNRLSGEPFWGCRVFPACRQTLPWTYHGRPTAEVQAEMQDNKDKSKGKGKDKDKATPKSSHMPKKTAAPRPTMSKRLNPQQGGYSSTSDGSWMEAGRRQIDTDSDDPTDKKAINVNLTEDEMEMIKEMRRSKAEMDRKDTE